MGFTIFPSSNFVTFIILSFLCFSPVFAASTDTLNSSQSLTFNQTLISAGAKFELGFFTEGNPKRYYAGIWYKDIPSVDTKVWVANRDSPSLNDSCILKLDDQSNLVILDDGSHVRWNSSSIKSSAKNPVLQLLDSGNLVIREAGDNNPDHYIWQSFDHPTDTLIPGQKLGWNLETGLDLFLTSWEAQDDPGSGNFTFKMDYHGDPELYMRKGDQITYRSGPWVGQRFSGVPEMASSTDVINFTFHRGKKEVYYTFELPSEVKIKSRLVITYLGKLERWTWVPNTGQWKKYWYATDDDCDSYKVCGSYAVCNTSLMFHCQCPQGFMRKDRQDWELRDGSSGCVRKTKLNCKSDGFVKLVNMKLPASSTAFVNKGLDLDECREMCRQNCSCTAFANLDVVQGSGKGCVFWTGNLIDMRDYVQGGQDLYLRLAASDLGSLASGDSSDDSARKFGMGIGIAIASAIIVAGLIILMILKRKKAENIIRRTPDTRASRTGATERNQEVLLNAQIISSKRDYSWETKNLDDVELPIFDIYTVAVATNNFDDANKLGQGGFGRVYKGMMLDGQEVAVKRLSKESGQGVEEFKNEVRLIAKLQHRNLVRLLGCCVEMDEKMLIYEYLKNRSLDAFLFHQERNAWLNWQMRFNIICGIARGLLYLHQDSRYRIIHRDLKASNILLDGDMNPKISDFGMARIFGGDQTEGNTRRVVGTYGYMAPEYAMDGLFSTKSDVFSFGVLVLEIISGTKNRGFYNSDQELNLLGYSWKVWREGKGTELLDKVMGDVYSIHEVLRCLQVGLLCVQERAEDRPTMGSVVLMLSSESASLPQPKLPGFCMGWNPNETDSSSSKQDESFTVNQVTVTMLNAR